MNLKHHSVIAIGLLLGSVAPTFAADANGYTARYECRAGGAYCNVDVRNLISRSCDQIITASMPWSAINWSSSTICIEAGDHTNKGTLTIPSNANGSAGSHKVLRYYRSGDNGDQPWQQSGSNQAKVGRLVIEGDYWLIDRLTFPPQSGSQPARMEFRASGSNDVRDIVVNRILIEGGGAGSHYYGIATNGDFSQDYQGLSIQNSVLRNLGPYAAGAEAVGISLHVGDSSRNSRFYIVNNEIYDWVSHPIQIGRNELPVIPGITVENNDLYVSPTLHRPDGRAASESPLSIKVSGTAVLPTRVMHNRIWGARWTDTGVCCTGESGQAITTYNSLNFLVVQNNVIGESHTGSYPTDRSSWVGNIFYSIKQYHQCGDGSCNSHVLQWGGNASEVYFNTVIDNPSYSFSIGQQSDSDIKCNVLVAASGRDPWNGSATSGSTEIDHNAFYESPKFTANGGDNNIAAAIKTRQNSTVYAVGDVVRTGSIESCTTDSDEGCFLYRVIAAGTSAASRPNYCTTADCTMDDGGVTLQAIRGPFTFHRKLRTGPETRTIPYTRVFSSAPETRRCPADYNAKRGTGIGDD